MNTDNLANALDDLQKSHDDCQALVNAMADIIRETYLLAGQDHSYHGHALPSTHAQHHAGHVAIQHGGSNWRYYEERMRRPNDDVAWVEVTLNDCQNPEARMEYWLRSGYRMWYLEPSGLQVSREDDHAWGGRPANPEEFKVFMMDFEVAIKRISEYHRVRAAGARVAQRFIQKKATFKELKAAFQ